MIKRIADDVWKIKVRFLEANVYLVDIDVPTLVDLGYYPDMKIILKDLESIGYSANDIKRVIFTHLHADHSGDPSCFANARFFASYNEIKNVKSLGMLFTYDSEATDKLSKAKLEPLKDKIGPFEVIPAPGHTSGSVCFYLRETGLLFTGDTLFGKHFGRTDVPTGSDKDLNKSLERLSKIKAKLLPGHDYG